MDITVLGTKEVELLRQILSEAAVSWGDVEVLRLAQVFQRASACAVMPEFLPDSDDEENEK